MHGVNPRATSKIAKFKKKKLISQERRLSEIIYLKKYPNNKKEKREREYRKDGINRKQISIL